MCRWSKNATTDAQAFRDALPNELNPKEWQELCRDFFGEPLERKVLMLHMWNWIPAPDGPFAHQNRAIPFLRAGLRVPSRSELDSPAGRDALETLGLGHGDAGGRLAAAFLGTDFGLGEWIEFGGILIRGKDEGEIAISKMREAEIRGDSAGYAAAASWGAAAKLEMEAEVRAKLSPRQRDVVDRFLASLSVHDHHSETDARDARGGHSHASSAADGG